MPIPVTIVGGYLGAGKTTLINRMLRQADGVKLAVLVNEFGAMPIDEDLIEAQDDALISIAGGCICCSFGSDLTAAMLRLATRDPAPDHIVVETSGVALPGAIASSISLLDRFAVDGICVLADCANAQTLARDEYIGDTITRQFEAANLLLLTKSDLVDPQALAAVQNWLGAGWPCTRQVIAAHGQVPNSVLLGQFPAPGIAQSSGHHDNAYDSLLLPCAAPVDARALAAALTAPDYGVLRAKGFVAGIEGRVALIQIIGEQCDVTYSEDRGATGVICIGRSGVLNKEALASLPAAHCERPEFSA